MPSLRRQGTARQGKLPLTVPGEGGGGGKEAIADEPEWGGGGGAFGGLTDPQSTDPHQKNFPEEQNEILLPSAVHLEERLTVSQSVPEPASRQSDRYTQFGFFVSGRSPSSREALRSGRAASV